MNTNSSRRTWERLAKARPGALDPEPDRHRRERDLARALASPAALAGREQRRRRQWLVPGVVALGASAAVVAVAVVVPSQGSDGPPTQAAGSSPTAKRSSSPPPASARQVLLAAASAAEQGSEAGSGNWRTRTRSAAVEPVTGADYLIEVRWRDENRFDPSSGRGTWTRTDLGGKPARPADLAAWKQAGSPRSWTITEPGPCPAGSGEGVCEADRTVGSEPSPPETQPLQQTGTAIYWLAGRNVSAEDLARLPEDPARLKAELLKEFNGCGTETCDGRPVRPEAWLFQSVGGLVTEMPVSPAVRAAAYRMLADLPGITVVRDARDPLNRRAVALTMRQAQDDGEVEVRLLFDPETWDGLAVEERVVAPDSQRPWAVAGLRLHYTAVESTGWTGQ